MRKIVLKIIVDMFFVLEKLKNYYGISEWEIYNAKYWKKESKQEVKQ